MALTKRLYKDHQTVITGQNLNEIQDAIIALEQMAGIVPGEGETTKVINVINAAGNLTAADAAAHPDGLYWLAQPVSIEIPSLIPDDANVLTLSGLCEKSGDTWLEYSTGLECTLASNGVLTAWGNAAPGTVALDFSQFSLGSFQERLDDGRTITHTVEFNGAGGIYAVGGITVSGIDWE